MKQLHLIAGKDPLRPMLHYIVVRNGFVYATNGAALIKMPTGEVFGDVEFAADEELLFEASSWGLCKFHQATSFTRIGLSFTNVKFSTTLVAKLPKEVDCKIPDFDSVLPDAEKAVVPITNIGFNTSIFADLIKAFGTKSTEEFQFQFYGSSSCIEVLHKDFPTTSSIIMPTRNETPVKEYTPIVPAPSAECSVEKEQPKKPSKKSSLSKTPSDSIIDYVLELLDKHIDTKSAIMDNYLSGDDGMLLELGEADSNLRQEIADIEVDDSYQKLLSKIEDHDDYNSDDLLKLVDDKEGESALHEYLQTKGYAIIKIDNIQDQSKLQTFVETELYPLYNDRNKYSI